MRRTGYTSDQSCLCHLCTLLLRVSARCCPPHSTIQSNLALYKRLVTRPYTHTQSFESGSKRRVRTDEARRGYIAVTGGLGTCSDPGWIIAQQLRDRVGAAVVLIDDCNE